MNHNILFIEDDLEIADLVQIHLKDAGYHVHHAIHGASGIEQARSNTYDLVILDVMLPDCNGFDVCKTIRQENATLPIIMLTAKSDEFDKVLGLELGADDYLAKPFGVRELIARVKALIRRSGIQQADMETASPRLPLVFGGLVIDQDKRKVTLHGDIISLTAKEFELLILFASNPGRAYSREQILECVWGYQYFGYEHTVNTHINRLRAKIERNPSRPRFITTVWGVGYRFAETEEEQVVSRS